jgi:hypothetical protein
MSPWCIHSPGPKPGGEAPWNPAPLKGIPGEPEGGPPLKLEYAGLKIEGDESCGAAGPGPEEAGGIVTLLAP